MRTQKARVGRTFSEAPMKTERTRIDVDATTRFIIEDLIGRGYFKDSQAVLTAAIGALQVQVADETYTDEYYDEDFQKKMDALQLGSR